MKQVLLSFFVLCLMSGAALAQDATPVQLEEDEPVISNQGILFDCDNLQASPPKTPCKPELQATRERLTQVYRQAFVALPEDQQDKFEEDQRVWVAKRDSTCSYAEGQKGPGTYIECANAHNGWRTQELLGEKPDYPKEMQPEAEAKE